MKYIKFKRLERAHHVVGMDATNSVYRKKVLDEKFHGGRPVGRPRLRREDDIRRDSLLLLNRRGQRRLAGYRDFWRRTTEEATALCKLYSLSIIVF